MKSKFGLLKNGLTATCLVLTFQSGYAYINCTSCPSKSTTYNAGSQSNCTCHEKCQTPNSMGIEYTYDCAYNNGTNTPQYNSTTGMCTCTYDNYGIS